MSISTFLLMAGCPGSGKSTLSKRLADSLSALRMDKDDIRLLLFPGRLFTHDDEINDHCMEVLYEASRLAVRKGPARTVILDGRTFAEAARRSRAQDVAARVGAQAVFIHCKAPTTVLAHRATPSDRAPNRPQALVECLRIFEPFSRDNVIEVETTQLEDESCEQVLRLLRERFGVHQP